TRTPLDAGLAILPDVADARVRRNLGTAIADPGFIQLDVLFGPGLRRHDVNDAVRRLRGGRVAYRRNSRNITACPRGAIVVAERDIGAGLARTRLAGVHIGHKEQAPARQSNDARPLAAVERTEFRF